MVNYLIGNANIGLIPAYRLSDRDILYDTGLDKERLGQCKREVEPLGILFISGYCCLGCDFGYFDYKGGKTVEARAREISGLPPEVREWFSQLLIAQSLPNDRATIGSINTESKMVNEKSEIKNQPVSPEKMEENRRKIRETLANTARKWP